MSFEVNPVDEQPADKEEYERWERKQKMVSVCREIEADMQKDAALLDDRPFNGRAVGTQFCKNMAAIQALARICKAILEGT